MSFLKTLFRFFLSGLILILPFAVTVAIVVWCSQLFVNYFGPSTIVGMGLSKLGITFAPEGMIAYFFGWFLVLFIIFSLGFFVDVFTKKMAVNFIDSLAKKIPILGPIYGTTRQFTDLMKTDGNKELQNMSPVYCRFGDSPGTLFLALLPTSDTHLIDGKEYKLVIIPTAPIPFGGAMIYVPATNIFPANMSIESLISLYVSMGVRQPDGGS